MIFLDDQTTITIHRGVRQIGGCVTEISSGHARVFIDFGENLPGVDSSIPAIDGLTSGSGADSALFLTHYHGDHIGQLKSVLPEVPVYMGETAKAIQMNLIECIASSDKPIYEKIKAFSALDKIKIGNMTVTPLMVDHSAFDAYMFVIDTGGCRILHTGDFRLHGKRGSVTPKMLTTYAKNIDIIICEGTMMSRFGESPISEYELQQKAKALMKTSKYVFVLCSSTHIDRIGVFYHANPKGRLFICDDYQRKQLETVRNAHADKSHFYNFNKLYTYGKNLDAHMEEKGFCMMIRNTPYFNKILEKYKNRCLIIYSMWSGYLDDRAKNQSLCDFLAPYKYEALHTSGHATAEDIRLVYDTVKPKKGLVPMHTETPEAFRKIIPKEKIIIIEDGEALSI